MNQRVKGLSLLASLIFLSSLVLIPISALAGKKMIGETGISNDILGGEPTAYCTVKSEPNPDLFGHWVGKTKSFSSAVWFGKKNDKYAFYYGFYRFKTGKLNAKWRPNIVDGNRIQNPEGVMKFWVEAGVLYSQYKKEPVTTYKKYVE